MPKSNILNRLIAEEYLNVITEAKKWTWKFNNWNVEPQDIGKLQKGKMGSDSKSSMPFSMVSRPSGMWSGDKGLVSKFVNKDHVVLQYYPMEEDSNNTMHDAVKKAGVKKIANLMKKEFDFKLIKTLKGKVHDDRRNNLTSRSFYLVFGEGNFKLTKDWKFGTGRYEWRRDAFAATGDIKGSLKKGMLDDGKINEKAIKGKDAGNFIKMAPKGRKLTMNGKTYISLGKGKWKDPDGKKIGWIELSAMASALGNKKVIYEAKLTKAHSKKIQNVLDRKNLSVEEVKPNQNFIFVSYTNYKDRSKIQTVVSEMGYKYEADGRSTNAPRIIGIAGHNWMQFSKGKIKESKLNEISVKAGFDDIKKGITTSIDGVKMSKDMVAAIMDWMAMSAYGRKYHKQMMKGSIHSLLKPADAWGIERFLKTGKLKKEWKAIIKKHKPKREGINEGVPFPQTTPNEFVFFDFKKWAYKNRGRLKKELLKHKDSPGKLWDKLSMIWMEWGKKTNNKEFTRITDKQKFGRALAIMLKKENVLFDKNPSPSHKIVVKEQNLVDMMKDMDTAGKLYRGEIEIPDQKKYFKPTSDITNPKPVTGLGGDHLMKNIETLGGAGNWLINQIKKSAERTADSWTGGGYSKLKKLKKAVDDGTHTITITKNKTKKTDNSKNVPVKQTDQEAFDDYMNLINNPPKEDSVVIKKKTKVVPVEDEPVDDNIQIWTPPVEDEPADEGVPIVLGLDERRIKKLEEVVFNKAMNIYRKEKLSEQGILKVANFIKKTVKPLIDKFTGNDEPEAQDIEKTEDRWYEPKPEPTDSVIDIMIKKEIKEQMAPSQTKFLSGKLKLKKGDKITYDQHFQFGKVSKNVTAKVVAVREYTVFLDKGPELDLRQDPIKKINGKAIK